MKPSKVISLRLPCDLAVELEAVSRVDEVPMSEVIRTAVRRHIAARRADKRFQARLREQLEKDREVMEQMAE
jgi:metal-responsive CopG/Arc/MetJ family transcriptional regulator